MWKAVRTPSTVLFFFRIGPPVVIAAVTLLDQVGSAQDVPDVLVYAGHNVERQRRQTMGDKGGKKDRDKIQKQKATKQEAQSKAKEDKKPKPAPPPRS